MAKRSSGPSSHDPGAGRSDPLAFYANEVRHDGPWKFDPLLEGAAV